MRQGGTDGRADSESERTANERLVTKLLRMTSLRRAV
jgi:hypothetical protein